MVPLLWLQYFLFERISNEELDLSEHMADLPSIFCEYGQQKDSSLISQSRMSSIQAMTASIAA